jgi:hypothetical protein
VGYNAAEIFLIFELKYFHENKFFSKMILTHESGAQEDQFDGKKRRPKISWYYPFKVLMFFFTCCRVRLYVTLWTVFFCFLSYETTEIIIKKRFFLS